MGGGSSTSRKHEPAQKPVETSAVQPPQPPTASVEVEVAKVPCDHSTPTATEETAVSAVAEPVTVAVPVEVAPSEPIITAEAVSQPANETQSIFDRLHDWFEKTHGNSDAASSAGELAIVALVETFYRKVLADPRLYPFFQGVSMEILRRHQFEFLRNVLSRGTFKYTGKPIRIGHTRLFDKGLNETHFDMVVEHLTASMKDVNLPEDIVVDIIGAVAPLRPIFEEEGKKRQ